MLWLRERHERLGRDILNQIVLKGSRELGPVELLSIWGRTAVKIAAMKLLAMMIVGGILSTFSIKKEAIARNWIEIGLLSFQEGIIMIRSD